MALKDHQILAGNVRWWSVCAPALRGLLGCFYAISATAEGEWVQPPAQLWEEYDDSKQLLRMLLRAGLADRTLFQASIVDSLDFYDVAAIPVGLGVHVRYVGSDANGHETGGIMSGIDYEAKTWTFARAFWMF